MKVLLVDDEPLARKRLRKLLADEVNIEIIGECASATEATQLIATLHPELLLLDVTLPDLNGIQLSKLFLSEKRPLVIFVTAHSNFAVDAFETGAVDYLLKPVRPARLHQALLRAREALEKIKTTIENNSELRRLAVSTNGQTLFVSICEIEWIEAARNYMVVHSRGMNHVVRETMRSLEGKLPQRDFIRLNRSVIVNLGSVKCLHKTGRGNHHAELNSGRRFAVTCGLRKLQERIKRTPPGDLPRPNSP